MKPISLPARGRRIVLLASGLVVFGGVTVLFLEHRPRPATVAAPAAAPLEVIVIPATPSERDDQLRPELRHALGFVVDAEPQQRLDLLRGLAGALSEFECEAVLHALVTPRGSTVPEGWHAEYFHALGQLMLEQPAARERFARVLATVAGDSGRDAVERDYAVQHLRRIWDRTAEDAALRGAVESTLTGLLNDPALAPAGLLSLHLLGTPDGSAKAAGRAFALGNSRLQSLVEPILAAQPNSDFTALRMVALRIAGERQLSALRPLVRRMTGEASGEPVLVRMAAIHCLAGFRDPGDRSYLLTLDRTDPRIDSALSAALR